VAATTVPRGENTTDTPIDSKANPIGPWRPNNTNSPNPTTVGGNTSGNTNTVSIALRQGSRQDSIAQAISKPKLTANPVAQRAAPTDKLQGDQSHWVTPLARLVMNGRAIA
jgi:hypothetical protein